MTTSQAVSTPTVPKKKRFVSITILIIVALGGLSAGGYMMNVQYGTFDGTSEVRKVVRSMLADLGTGKSIGRTKFQNSASWGVLEDVTFDSVNEETTYAGKSYTVSGSAKFNLGPKTFHFNVAQRSGQWVLVEGKITDHGLVY